MTRQIMALWIAATVTFASQTAVPVAVAQSWSLEQNDPNPFCPFKTVTTFQFSVAETSPVLFQIWNPSGTEVVRTLVEGVLSAGVYSFVWDGRDDQGAVVPNGEYPYRMTAGEPPVFEDAKIAIVLCATAVDASTWGFIKAKYGR